MNLSGWASVAGCNTPRTEDGVFLSPSTVPRLVPCNNHPKGGGQLGALETARSDKRQCGSSAPE
jgi:hypothetical protein